MKKQRTTTIQHFFSLPYLSIENVPVSSSPHGDIVEADLSELENLAAQAIIKARVPLRGKEIKVFRKLLGYSFEKFASEIGLTSGSIFKWERDLEERLHPINEIAVRAYLAEKFDVDIPGKYSELLGNQKKAAPLVVKIR